MDFLGPFHPQITHAPIVLVIVGLLFELIGWALDREWWRKAASAMLALGVAAAMLSVLSGNAAEELAERQNLPEGPIEAHEEVAKLSMWVGLGALLLRALAARSGKLRPVVAGAALLAWLWAAVLVGVAAHRGGVLVFEHGAGVQTQGAPAGATAGETGESAGAETD